MRKYSATIIWSIALLAVFFMDPAKESISFCVFRFMGFDACPGCGIGHSIHYALHLQFGQSFREHIFGIPATIGILYLIIESFPQKKHRTTNGPTTTNAYDAS